MPNYEKLLNLPAPFFAQDFENRGAADKEIRFKPYSEKLHLDRIVSKDAPLFKERL